MKNPMTETENISIKHHQLLKRGKTAPDRWLCTTQFDNRLLLTFKDDDGCKCWEAQGVGVTDQIIGLHSVSKRNPHQIAKSQHEAKTIVHQVHGGEDGLLQRQTVFIYSHCFRPQILFIILQLFFFFPVYWTFCASAHSHCAVLNIPRSRGHPPRREAGRGSQGSWNLREHPDPAASSQPWPSQSWPNTEQTKTKITTNVS